MTSIPDVTDNLTDVIFALGCFRSAMIAKDVLAVSPHSWMTNNFG